MIKTFVIQTNSMKPSIKAGDLLIAVQEPSFKVGDVVYFSVQNKIYVHRIVAKIPFTSFYLEKGDAYNIPGLLSKKNIVGKIIKPDYYCKIPRLLQFKFILRYLFEILRSTFNNLYFNAK